jgi:radical SAM protein with 4Fe4S-binding SPASM domain
MTFKKHHIGAADMLSALALKNGAPTCVVMQVTDRCNYSCSHCFQAHDNEDELTTEEIRNVLQQLADEGVLFLTFMGGEFFMRRDADELLQMAHDMGFALKLKTTGHHIHDKRADFLASVRPLQVDLSVYGSHAELHEKVTLHPGSFQRTIDAAKRLLDRNILVKFNTVVTEANMYDTTYVQELAKEMGAQFGRDPKITTTTEGDVHPTNLRMSQASLEHFYQDMMADHLSQRYEGWSAQKAPSLDNTPCRAGKEACHIDAQGNIHPCGRLPMPMGNLRKQSFREIWYGSEELEDVRNLTWAQISECRECELRGYCSRCHAMALIEHGKMKGPSLEACRHAVTVRDSLRERGIIPEGETALPPTWDRIDMDGQHSQKTDNSSGKRSPLLRVLQ